MTRSATTTVRSHRLGIVVMLLALILLACDAIVLSQSVQANEPPAVTPTVGTPLRKEILDGLRREVFNLHGMQMVFVVENIRVVNDWAWLDTHPQSPDGTSRYEDLSALMHNKNGIWEVAEIPCTEEDNPDCISDSGYFTSLMRRFPDIPQEIFPRKPTVE